jgi:CRP/FNR family transcriptional regulator
MEKMIDSGGLPPGLAALGRRRAIKAGTLIFQQDEPAASCLYIESGEVSLRRFSGSGEIEIARVGAGEWCGEVILFAEDSYPAQAVAVQDGLALEFRRSDILGASDPEVRSFFLGLLARKCLKLNRRIEQLTIMDTRERLAQYILGLCPGQASGCRGDLSACSFPFPKKKREIAEELGMAPETLSRGLRQLETEGLVKIEGPRIKIPSCDGLLRLIGER